MIYTINTDAVDLGYINNTATVNASTINSTVVSDTSDDGDDSDGNTEDDVTIVEMTSASSQTTIFPELEVIKSAVVNKTGTQTGLIAQEAEAVLASTVVTNSTGIKTLHTDDIFWHMLNAIKELSVEVEKLKNG